MIWSLSLDWLCSYNYENASLISKADSVRGARGGVKMTQCRCVGWAVIGPDDVSKFNKSSVSAQWCLLCNSDVLLFACVLVALSQFTHNDDALQSTTSAPLEQTKTFKTKGLPVHVTTCCWSRMVCCSFMIYVPLK